MKPFRNFTKGGAPLTCIWKSVLQECAAYFKINICVSYSIRGLRVSETCAWKGVIFISSFLTHNQVKDGRKQLCTLSGFSWIQWYLLSNDGRGQYKAEAKLPSGNSESRVLNYAHLTIEWSKCYSRKMNCGNKEQIDKRISPGKADWLYPKGPYRWHHLRKYVRIWSLTCWVCFSDQY